MQHITTQKNQEPEGNVYVDPECRKVFVNLKRIKRTDPALQSTLKKKKRRSYNERFSSENKLFLL